MVLDITLGKDGWIFLTGGGNNVEASYSGHYSDLLWVGKWQEILQERNEKLLKFGIKYFHVVAPEKIAIYKNFLPDLLFKKIIDKEAPARKVGDSLASKHFYIDPRFYLMEQSVSYMVYHKTDSHWNFYGAYSVYQLLMQRMGYATNDAILSNMPATGSCAMDLGGKCNPQVLEDVAFYKPRACVKRVWKNSLVKYKEENDMENMPGLHVGSSVKFENSDALYHKKILIFGDSFSEYRPQLLTGMLAETFSDVMFVWNQNIDYSIIEDFKPDIVITETAERFMPFSVPDDRFNLNEFVSERMRCLK